MIQNFSIKALKIGFIFLICVALKKAVGRFKRFRRKVLLLPVPSTANLFVLTLKLIFVTLASLALLLQARAVQQYKNFKAGCTNDG